MSKLHVDDLVRLNSGSPLLTVIGLSNSPTLGPGAIVQWLDETGISQIAHFPETCLSQEIYFNESTE